MNGQLVITVQLKDHDEPTIQEREAINDKIRSVVAEQIYGYSATWLRVDNEYRRVMTNG